MNYRSLLMASALASSIAGQAFPQAGPANDFRPDVVLPNSRFTTSGAVGAANWSVSGGAITADASAGPGLLPLGGGLQDVDAFVRFRCASACAWGMVFRLEATPTGMKGIMLNQEGDTASLVLATFNKAGKLLTQTPAPNLGQAPSGSAAPPPPPPAATPVLAAARAALTAPVRVAPNAWNTVGVSLQGGEISAHLNRVRNSLGRAKSTGDEPLYGYGPVALYVGSGRVEFADVALKDLFFFTDEKPPEQSRFTAQRLTPFYYSWGADVGDINRDGITDVVAGPFYYLGPDYLKRGEIYRSPTFSPSNQYSVDMLTFVHDWTGDGRPDVVATDRRPLVMYVSPAEPNRRWKRVNILPEVCSEIAIKRDLNGDGAPEVIYVGADGRLAFGRPDTAALEGPWRVKKVSEALVEGCNTHGLGAGDVNGDGRVDIVYARGWVEQPATGIDGDWVLHPESFGDLTRSPQHPGGAEMAVYDFNGDGWNDIVTSTSAHGWGLAWFEKKRDAAGRTTWMRHNIMGDFSTKNAGDVTFSELHSGATLADVNRDGVMDFVTGKRHWSHLDAVSDPDPRGAAVIYAYITRRNRAAPGGVEFVPELIDNHSGVGSQVTAADINKDGVTDLVTSGDMGAFIFWGKRTRN